MHRPKKIGIIGGGQLGMMLTEAAKNLSKYISDVTVLDPNPNCPASIVGAKHILGKYDDKSALLDLIGSSDIITYEIESGHSKLLTKFKDKITIHPSPKTLEIIQDKLLQKKFLRDNNLPVPMFSKITSFSSLKKK